MAGTVDPFIILGEKIRNEEVFFCDCRDSTAEPTRFRWHSVLGLMLVATSSVCSAQSVMPTGTWQLNLAKSKFAGPALKSTTEYIEGEGQNRKITIVGIDAAGTPFSLLYSEAAEDGKPHPVTGSPTPAYVNAD
jgi:hypothetical protein